MIPKKNPNVDLEKRKTIFFEIGLVLALLITLISFEWTTKVEEADTLTGLTEMEFEEEMIPITRQDKPLEKAAPLPVFKALDVIQIVDDEEVIEHEIELEDVEADQNTKVEVQVPRIVDEEDEIEEEVQIFVVVEDMPIFRPDICKTTKEGEIELYRYINSQIRYPVLAQENGIQGRVFVGFVVDPDGGVSNIHVLRGIDPALDKEAVRVIESLPKFSPGKQRGIPVKVSYTAVINFVLQ